MSSSIVFPSVRDSFFDPPTALMDIRGGDPIRRLRFADGVDGWIVVSMATAKDILSDRRFSTGDQRSLPVAKPFQIGPDGYLLSTFHDRAARAPETHGFIFLDPPDHTVFRRLLAPYLSPKRIAEHGSLVGHIVRSQVDLLREAGPGADFVENFAIPVPLRTICAILGLDYSRASEWRRPVAVAEDPTSDLDAEDRALHELAGTLRSVLADKVRHPKDDLLTVIAGSELSEPEKVGLAGFLLIPGFTTTSSMLGLATLALLEQRSRWDQLRADPERISAAVEEMLRYLTIFQLGAVTRTALEDIRVGGIDIRRGEPVLVSLPLVNRDGEFFQNPDVFDLTRDAFGHLAFGYGIHQCVGQHLARMEMTIVFKELIENFPNLDLAIPNDAVEMRPGFADFNGVERLPVRW